LRLGGKTWRLACYHVLIRQKRGSLEEAVLVRHYSADGSCTCGGKLYLGAYNSQMLGIGHNACNSSKIALAEDGPRKPEAKNQQE
jgi:hypothetical protein